MVSGFKKSNNKKKEKFVLAKDPKQAKIAIAVIVIFIINSIYTAIKIYQENNPPAAPTETASTATTPENPTDPMLTGDPSMQVAQETTAPAPVDPNAPSPTTAPAQTAPQDLSQDANDIYFQTISQRDKNNLNGPAQLPDSTVDIIAKKNKQKRLGKTVLISVDSTGSVNPFMPNDGSGASLVPKALPYLTAPPESVLSNSDAGKVMETTISGILYDKYSPSAIIKIDGNDYLVKPGDIINRYKILQIGKTEVIVQLGKNVYKAGVGELLSLTSLNYNTIANLNKKFGGNHVQIKVKKKG